MTIVTSKELARLLSNKSIVITGGTGSFGNSVVTKLLSLPINHIYIISRDEKKQSDMRNRYNNKKLNFIIADVRDADAISTVFRKINIDYVFHAAALKQVPSCEFFPLEAVKTNIYGTQNVISAAIQYGVKRLVILSTDKAAYPINAMGMSKALMEKLMVANSRELQQRKSQTILCGVRYGNVLYSRGSVIPYFIYLIQQKKPLTITNKDMTRFLLPLSDAVDLILFSLVKGVNGSMYVKKAPASSIENIAKALIKIFNHSYGYKEVGNRSGEKIHETLVTSEEMARSIDLGNYYQIPPESQGLDYNKYFLKGDADIAQNSAYTSENTQQLSLKDTIELLKKLPQIQHELSSYMNGKSAIVKEPYPIFE